jgi:hypothetical protein
VVKGVLQSSGARPAFFPSLFAADDSGRHARGEDFSGVIDALQLTPAVTVLGVKLRVSATIMSELNWSYLLDVSGKYGCSRTTSNHNIATRRSHDPT